MVCVPTCYVVATLIPIGHALGGCGACDNNAMSGHCHIHYASYYGSTRQYADALAGRLGAVAEQIPAPSSVSSDATAGPIVVLAPAHGPMHDGVKFVLALDGAVLRSRPIALATVGMTLDDEAASKDATGDLLGVSAEHVARFYLPGRMNYSALSGAHKTVMAGVVGGLRLKRRKSANERNMIDTYGKDVDRVDLSRLDPVVQWVQGHGGG